MILNVINLDPDTTTDVKAKEARQSRVLSVVRQSKEQGFCVQFKEGCQFQGSPQKNICIAFKNLIRHAKNFGMKNICIAEDDIIFTGVGAWRYYLDQMPTEFDLYLGGVYSAQFNGNRITNGYSGHTLVTFNESMYDVVLNANENDHLDRYLGNFAFEKNYIVCNPFVVMQMGGYSENKRRVMNYDEYHKQFKYFGL